jgi:hypothetical protein
VYSIYGLTVNNSKFLTKALITKKAVVAAGMKVGKPCGRRKPGSNRFGRCGSLLRCGMIWRDSALQAGALAYTVKDK